MEENMTNNLLTVAEVADMLKISRRSVRELCRNRARQTTRIPIPVIRLNPKCVRFSKTAIEAWIVELQKESVQQ
jgi:predicted DNA-binding transcriptional regulator AlpA